MDLKEIYGTALFQKSINDIVDLLLREQVDLMKMKRMFNLKAKLRTSEQEKYRRIAQCIWVRGAMWRD